MSAPEETENSPEDKTPSVSSSSVGDVKEGESNEFVSDGMMKIKVYSPYQVYFNDQASSISAVNDTGPFDILPQHHKFLTLLSPCELNIAARNGAEKIKISRGIMYVKEDKVTVFLDV